MTPRRLGDYCYHFMEKSNRLCGGSPDLTTRSGTLHLLIIPTPYPHKEVQHGIHTICRSAGLSQSLGRI